MPTPKHTPGPWRWSYHPINNERIALVAGDTDVLLCTGDDSHAWGVVASEADARLLQSAPALAAALQKCFLHLGEEIQRKTLNESAKDGTQALSKEVAKLLDAALT